jgi:hypothetical protein
MKENTTARQRNWTCHQVLEEKPNEEGSHGDQRNGPKENLKSTISIHFTVAWNSLTPPGDFSAARNADLHMLEPGAECSW